MWAQLDGYRHRSFPLAPWVEVQVDLQPDDDSNWEYELETKLRDQQMELLKKACTRPQGMATFGTLEDNRNLDELTALDVFEEKCKHMEEGKRRTLTYTFQELLERLDEFDGLDD